MTKKDIIEAMKDLDDDAEVRVYCTSMDSDGGQYAHDIYFDDIVKGADLQNEITIVAHCDIYDVTYTMATGNQNPIAWKKLDFPNAAEVT